MRKVPIPFGVNRTICFFVLFALLCWGRGDGYGAGRFDESQVKTVFLYNLTHFTTWPDAAFPTPESPFIITIVGEDPFGKNLDEILKNETVGRHPIVVRRIQAVGEMEKSHMVYLSQRFAKDIEALTQSRADFGLLTVSDFQRFAHRGGCVNLLVRNRRLILELNVAAAEKNGLKFSSKLLRLANIVD